MYRAIENAGYEAGPAANLLYIVATNAQQTQAVQLLEMECSIQIIHVMRVATGPGFRFHWHGGIKIGLARPAP